METDILSECLYIRKYQFLDVSELSIEEKVDYHESLKSYRDLNNTMDTKFDEGKMEGKIKGKIEAAISFKKLGVSIDIIIQATGLTKEEIDF
jgi:predicted transposase/invertase (TIGR01784 family)